MQLDYLANLHNELYMQRIMYGISVSGNTCRAVIYHVSMQCIYCVVYGICRCI